MKRLTRAVKGGVAAVVVSSIVLWAAGPTHHADVDQSPEAPVAVDRTLTTGDSTTAGTVPSSPSTPPTSLIPPRARGGDPLAVTPTGVVVPVLGRTAEGMRVRTPCGHRETIAWGQPVTDVEVVLDPGHGGDEPGAERNGVVEADLNLAVARRSAVELEQMGIRAVLTRSRDYRMPVSERAALADHVDAAALVSIHHNTPLDAVGETPGTEVYVQQGSDESARLGRLLRAEVSAALDRFDIEWGAAADPAVLTVIDDGGSDAYGILRRPLTPSALVELARMTPGDELDLLTSDAYVDAAGAAVARAIGRYLNDDDPNDVPAAGGPEVSDETVGERLVVPGTDTGGRSGCIDPELE